MTRVTLSATDFSSSGGTGPQPWGQGVAIQGFDWNNKPARIVYDTQFDDFGLGVKGGFFDQLDFSKRAGNVAERVEIDFGGTVENVVVTLGQFNPSEYGYFESGTFKAIDADGDVVENGRFSPRDSVLGNNEKVPGSLKMYPVALGGDAAFDKLVLEPTAYNHGNGDPFIIDDEKQWLSDLNIDYPDDYPWEQNTNFNIVELAFDRVESTDDEVTETPPQQEPDQEEETPGEETSSDDGDDDDASLPAGDDGFVLDSIGGIDGR